MHRRWGDPSTRDGINGPFSGATGVGFGSPVRQRRSMSPGRWKGHDRSRVRFPSVRQDNHSPSALATQGRRLWHPAHLAAELVLEPPAMLAVGVPDTSGHRLPIIVVKSAADKPSKRRQERAEVVLDKRHLHLRALHSRTFAITEPPRLMLHLKTPYQRFRVHALVTRRVVVQTPQCRPSRD